MHLDGLIRLLASLADPEAFKITSPMSANVWKICVRAGEKVTQEGQELAVYEAMKMEIRESSSSDSQVPASNQC